jgi:glycosyltransferase involved in cell wall biosynthesis
MKNGTNRDLTILSIAYPFAPVREETAGGAEQVLSVLDSALVRSGTKSVVIACSGSRTAGNLIPVTRTSGLIDDKARCKVWQEVRKAINTIGKERKIDLFHMHGLDFPQYLPPSGIPVLVTLHLPLQWYAPDVFRIQRPQTYLQCVSENQRRTCPPGAVLHATIENGVPVDQMPFIVHKSDYVAALGRICPEKGYHHAISAAKKSGYPIIIAGEIYPYESHVRYFEQMIRPHIDGSDCRFIGRVGWKRKCRLIAHAHCILIPSRAPETSSLVAMEALACGTPVAAFRSGALAEIIENGKTGFIIDTEDEMADAISRARQINPMECRRAALERFSQEKMIQRYFELYQTAISETNTLRPNLWN